RVGSDDMWLQRSDIPRLRQILAPNHILSEAEAREVLTLQLRNVVPMDPPAPAPKPHRWKRLAFIIAPVLVLLVCTIVLLATCYPEQVFAWGDEAQRQETLSHRRKTLWGMIVSLT